MAMRTRRQIYFILGTPHSQSSRCFLTVGGSACGPLAGLFYGLGVRSVKRSDSSSEVPRDELDGEECKAKV